MCDGHEDLKKMLQFTCTLGFCTKRTVTYHINLNYCSIYYSVYTCYLWKYLLSLSAAYAFTLIYNFLTAMALLIQGADEYHAGETFGLSILYLVANVPLSFLCWYRPAYNALK